MTPGVASWLPTLIFVPLIGLLLYRRLRRTFGRQPVTPKRMAFRMVLLVVVSIALLVGVPTLAGGAAAAAGAAAGVALAWYGLIHTQFENTPEGAFYTPNKWIGLAVTALFLGRLAARMFTIYEARLLAAPAAPTTAGFPRSPLTVAIFFVMAAYYLVYYAGILRRSRAPIDRKVS